MASKNSTTAASLASKMQLRTRKQMRFDEMEAKLPDPRPLPALGALARGTASAILSHFGPRALLSKPITNDDIVWLFDNTAFKASRTGSWQAEFVSAVFEREPKCKVVDVVSAIAGLLGLADDAEEFRTIEERLLPFLWDIRPGRQVRVAHGEQDIKLGPTRSNGLSSDVLKISGGDPGTIDELVISNAQKHTSGLLKMKTTFAGPEGWAIISGKSGHNPHRQSRVC
jgi:hypothetical protein